MTPAPVDCCFRCPLPDCRDDCAVHREQDHRAQFKRRLRARAPIEFHARRIVEERARQITTIASKVRSA